MYTIKLLFAKYSSMFISTYKFKPCQDSAVDTGLFLVFLEPYLSARRYGRKFYRNLLNKKYSHNIQIKDWGIKFWVSSVVVRKPFSENVSYRPFFHVKTFFNINEFLMYDYYNFHRSFLIKDLGLAKYKNEFFAKKPWRKINFFFYIRNSINVFRTHTLQFFKTKYDGDRRVTVFLKSFLGVHPLTYIWFFEYSLPYFLVKIRFAESLGQALLLVYNDVVFVNGSTGFNRWSTIKPSDYVQLCFNIFFIARTKMIILKFFKFFKKTKKFFKRTILRARKYRTKMPNMTAKSLYMSDTKHINFRMFESDYKSLSVALVPYSNPTVYFATITLFWLNFWNYRLSIWKYDIILKKSAFKIIQTYVVLCSYFTRFLYLTLLLVFYAVLIAY